MVWVASAYADNGAVCMIQKAARVLVSAEAPDMDKAEVIHSLWRTHKDVKNAISDEELKLKIADVKAKSKNGGMEPDEYFKVWSHVRDNAPQNLLVWGLGYDSVMLDRLNEGGYTLFLEFDTSWVSESDASDLNYMSYDANELQTNVSDFAVFLESPHRTNLTLVEEVPCWDTILVDSPNGFRREHPGRGVPIYTAKKDIEGCIASSSYATNKIATVFVHDCNREAEDAFTRKFLGAPIVELGFKQLREFQFKQAVL